MISAAMIHVRQRSLTSPNSPPVAAMAATVMVLLSAAPPGASAQAPELVTDRPDQTESAVVVPPGYFQLELGWFALRQDDDGHRLEIRQVPGTLVRIGVTEAFELRLGWRGVISEEARNEEHQADRSGAGDSDLGAKFLLHRGSGIRPQVALLVGTSLPTGDDDFTTDRLDPAFRFSVAHDLSSGLALGYNLGMAWTSEVDDRGQSTSLSEFFYTLALGIDLSSRWGTYVEAFGGIPASAEGGPTHSLDAGITYLVRPNLQLDLTAGGGLSDAADDGFIGLGLSVRFPR
jgi:hypothetical protein